MFASVKRFARLLCSKRAWLKVKPDDRIRISPAEAVAIHKAAIENLRLQFDEMSNPDQVKEWFRSQKGFFFTDWPRGKTFLSIAIEGANDSRFAEELAGFLLQLEAHWHDPFKIQYP